MNTHTNGDDLVHTPINTSNARGLTKREYFAALALNGLLSSNQELFSAIRLASKIQNLEIETHISQMAAESADALIVALNKGVKNENIT